MLSLHRHHRCADRLLQVGTAAQPVVHPFADERGDQTDERPEAQFAATYLGGKAANYDVVKVETGPYTIAATEASLQTELTVAVRDRAVQAFNQIMAMQI